ncbi:MAG: hypothetical protein FJX89_01690 [Bacteroidetes bacterium]|nr:hypothetical protein [Bacteroidota bacterium]
MNRFLPTAIYLTVFITSLIFHEMSRLLVWVLLTVSLLSIIDKMGKGIVLRESIAFLYIMTCLVMPIMGYDIYNQNFHRAGSVGYTMQVTETIYFSYVIPAVTGFCLTITFPLQSKDYSDDNPGISKILERATVILKNEQVLGIVIMFAGLMSFAFNKVLPVFLQYVSTILFLTCFVSLLYIYYSPNRSNKSIIILTFSSAILFYSMSIGMFTIMIYMGITISSFFFLGNKMSLFRKVTILLAAFFIITVIQNTKRTFRNIVFNKGSDNKVELFAKLFVENLSSGTGLFESKAFFPVYLRLNQGWIISKVIHRFPAVKEHDNGKVLFNTIFASFIPRFLWPDKPTADGHFNMRYYAGTKLSKYTSMNVGPLGESYASFGAIGGIAFLFLIGVSIRWVYGLIFSLSRHVPLIIFWIPVMFYQITYSAETDLMQILNSIIKVSVFMSVIYFFLPSWLGRRRSTNASRQMTLSLQ